MTTRQRERERERERKNKKSRKNVLLKEHCFGLTNGRVGIMKLKVLEHFELNSLSTIVRISIVIMMVKLNALLSFK